MGSAIARACLAVALPRSTYPYQPKERDDSQLIQELQQLVEKHPSLGFWSCFHRIRRMGHQYNHKRVYRVYTARQLNIRRRLKKRLPARVKQALFQPERINQVWPVDFRSDQGSLQFKVKNFALSPLVRRPSGQISCRSGSIVRQKLAHSCCTSTCI
jgi:hypothetical protein